MKKYINTPVGLVIILVCGILFYAATDLMQWMGL